ncbi:MAG: hypothetical protein U0798_08335 [Gemmataceae bacterium]
MNPAALLDRDEWIEQAYFFRVFRERIAENLPAQDILSRIHQELLSTTRLPYAVEFLGTELKHSGLLANGFSKLPHYFTPFQAFLVRQAEDERSRLTMTAAFMALEREATYKASQPTQAGLFVYQFETIARNRLSYDEGLAASAADPFYSKDWKDYLELVRIQVGAVDFCDLVYLRSELYVKDVRRNEPNYVPPVPPIFGEKEGKIAKANRGRDPLFLFAALQRQLGYPEVPRVRARDDIHAKLDLVLGKLSQLEQRLKLAEGELRGTIDWTEFGSPELFKNKSDD